MSRLRVHHDGHVALRLLITQRANHVLAEEEPNAASRRATQCYLSKSTVCNDTLLAS